MVFFVGEYPRQLDDRGRFILPAKLREKLSGIVYITKAPFEHCLNIYTEEEWANIAEQVRTLPAGNDMNVAKFARRLFSKANEFEIDKQGRIPLTSSLAEAADLKKDIVLVGANNKIEIWDAEIWKKASEEDEDNDILAEGMQKYQVFL